MGLSVARDLIEAHGGTIRADDRDGGGAIFSVTLPRFDAPSREPSGDKR
ncbi:MAG: ATP-binding protein [Acidimicrobiales bacterium]